MGHRGPQLSLRTHTHARTHFRTQYVNINRKTHETLHDTNYRRPKSSLLRWFDQKCGLIIFQWSCQAHLLDIHSHSLATQSLTKLHERIIYFFRISLCATRRVELARMLRCMCVWFWHYVCWVRAGVLLYGRHIIFCFFTIEISVPERNALATIQCAAVLCMRYVAVVVYVTRSSSHHFHYTP